MVTNDICISHAVLLLFAMRIEEKTGEAQDGLRVIPMDVLKAELFFPQRNENKETGDMVKRTAVEVADCILTEL